MEFDIVDNSPSPPQCIGLMGKIFGHKFFFGWLFSFDQVEETDVCQRCGMPKGGWPS